MLVLFMGSRGSGKSTIAHEVSASLAGHGINYIKQDSYRSRLKNIFQKIWFMISVWRFFNFKIFRVYIGRMLRDILHRRNFGSLYRLYFPLIFSYNLSQIDRKKNSVLIYDTDTFYWVADLVLSERFNLAQIQNFYHKTLLPKAKCILIVIVDTPVVEAVRRTEMRDYQGSSSDKKTVSLERRYRWQQVREVTAELLSDIPGVSIMRLDGLLEPKLNATRVVEMLLSHYSSA